MNMRRTMLLFAGILMVLPSLAVAEKGHGHGKALENVSAAKVYFDVNVGKIEKLQLRLGFIEKTIEQLVAAGVAPTVVVGVRGKASRFVTRGKGYLSKGEESVKHEIDALLKRLHARGIGLEQCAIAAGLHGIDKQDFLPNLHVVENGYISMIGYQSQGYAMVPMD